SQVPSGDVAIADTRLSVMCSCTEYVMRGISYGPMGGTLVKKAQPCAPHYAPDAQGLTALIVSSPAERDEAGGRCGRAAARVGGRSDGMRHDDSALQEAWLCFVRTSMAS